MKDLRSKKAIAASLSLTLALGSVPAVALADDADENSEGATSEQSTQAELSFSANGGQFTDGSTGVTIKANEDGSINAPTPTRAGFTFKGWYSQSDMDGIPENYQQYYKLDPSSAKAGSWFAAWEKNAEVQAQSVEVVSFFQADEQKTEQNQINVLYAANGGQFADGNDTMQGVTDSDGMMRQPAAPTREGYTFAGWYWVSDLSVLTEEQKEQNKVDFTQPVTKPHATMYAQWVKNQDEINVLYAANGGQFADGNDTMQGVTDSDGMMRQPAAPTREGYTFAGWYWVSDLSGLTDEQKDLNKVDFSQSVAGKEHVTVFAQWTKNADTQAEQITVKFVDNFNETESSTEVKKGETVAQPADPTYDGWTFEGWSSTLKDDEGNWEYTPVDFGKAVEDEDQDGVVTYYAFYSENQVAADDTANGEEAAVQEAAGDDADAADEPSIAPQTGDATNVAAVAGIGGIAGLLAAAAALLRRRRSN